MLHFGIECNNMFSFLLLLHISILPIESNTEPTNVAEDQKAGENWEKGEGVLQDDIPYYFARTEKHLSREDELNLANQIVATRQEWREILLSDIFGQSRTLALYRTASAAEPRAMMRILQVTDGECADALRENLSSLLPQISMLVGQNTSVAKEKIDQLRRGQNSDEENEDRIDETLRLMESRKLTDTKLQEVMDEMKQLLKSLEEYEAQWKNPNQCPELIKLISENVIWPEQFKRTVERLQHFYNQWQDARKRMIMANTRLVIHLAKGYRNRGLGFSDLIAQGNLGLMSAVDRFEPERGVKFSTYATHCVRSSITHGLANQAKIIRIPAHQFTALVNIRIFIQRYAEKYGGQRPSHKIIGEELGLTPTMVKRIISSDHRATSLDKTFGADEDPKVQSPISEVYTIEMRDAIANALRTLPKNERDIIILQFGLGLKEVPSSANNPQLQFVLDENQYGISFTYEEIGRKLGITRERVRQLLSKALERLSESTHPLRFDIATHKENGTKPQRVGSLAERDSDPRFGLCFAEIGVSTKAMNAFERLGVFTVGDYLQLTDEYKENIPYMGRSSIKEIDAAIARLRLQE